MVTDNELKIIKFLRENKDGLTIQELSDKSELSRNTVKIILAKLDGEEKIKIRNVGMAKLHYLKSLKNKGG